MCAQKYNWRSLCTNVVTKCLVLNLNAPSAVVLLTSTQKILVVVLVAVTASKKNFKKNWKIHQITAISSQKTQQPLQILRSAH
ncbi:hypothetical protein [Blackfly microvirus SF02]|uniref:Uncharacterized protein n=1 Tax=Blackfly microvirus SF02 TaxID=2576452 RepID=A0A4P8PTQ4_9VIRU|nr:hypothetical protein [Blackfly microvirus SF02]